MPRRSLLLHCGAARVREFDLAELMAMLGEGDARRGQRNGDQTTLRCGYAFSSVTLHSKLPTALFLQPNFQLLTKTRMATQEIFQNNTRPLQVSERVPTFVVTRRRCVCYPTTEGDGTKSATARFCVIELYLERSNSYCYFRLIFLPYKYCVAKTKGRRPWFRRPSSNLAPRSGHSSQRVLHADRGDEINF